jgi:glycosyltransferase involved in cell wall biosynthesis
MRVCLFGTFDQEYVRNLVLVRALESQGVQVDLCHASIWPSTDMRVAAARRGWRNVALLGRILRAHWRLVRQHAHLEPYDLLMVGYPGYLEAPLARLLTWIRRRPLVFDAFISLHETVVEDRALISVRSPLARLLYVLDWLAMRLADRVLVDTRANADHYHRRFGVPRERILVVPVGADEATYYPRKAREHAPGVRVLYFGKFIPLHGIEHILQAAHLLKHEPSIRFTLIGGGQTYEAMRALASDLALDNLNWGPTWLAPDALADEIAQADICLGIFGASAKAQRVIPTKAYIALAMAKPLVTMESAAARQTFSSGRDALLCQPADPGSLAEAILTLRDDPALRQRLAANGFELYQRLFSTPALGTLLAGWLESSAVSIPR